MTTLAERFWAKVSQGPMHQCWEWQAATNAKGYGWFCVHLGKSTTAHRVAAWLVNMLPSLDHQLHVLHKCDNRKCCNPDHFFLGSNKDNVADRVAKNRSGSARLHGELNGQAKLTDAQATQIKILYTNKVYSQGMLAKQFNIRQSQVSRIVNGVRRGGVS